VDNVYDAAVWIRSGAVANKWHQPATSKKLFIPTLTAKQK